MNPIWTDDFLNQLWVDAQQEINQDLQCIFWQFCLSTFVGTDVYIMPDFVRSIRRITWRGKQLEGVNLTTAQLLFPAAAPGFIGTTVSRPLYYCINPSATYAVRFMPTPDEAFLDTGDTPFSPSVNPPACMISCWRTPDDSSSNPLLTLPDYIDRRTRKAYVLWKAYAADTPGQDLRAAQYYQKKYQFIIDRFRAINSGCFVSKNYALGDGYLEVDNYGYPKPTLPPNFPRTIYR